MMCPNCDAMKTYIIDSMDREDYTSLRKRECRVCGYRFYTTEILIQAGILKRRNKDG